MTWPAPPAATDGGAGSAVYRTAGRRRKRGIHEGTRRKDNPLLGHGLLTVPRAPTEGLRSPQRRPAVAEGARSGDRAPTSASPAVRPGHRLNPVTATTDGRGMSLPPFGQRLVGLS